MLTKPESLVRCFSVFLFAAGIWWIGGFYRGFEHDAVFYAAEALWRGGVAPLGQDPFFHFGSQGAFSIFVGPYAWLLKQGDVAKVALGVTLTARLAWLLALLALVRSIAPSMAAAALGIAAVLIMPSYYEPFRVFAYAEAFATPRIVAETVSLVALAAIARGRRCAGAVAVLLALALHPLMALPAVAAVLINLGTQYRPDKARTRSMRATASWVLVSGLLLVAVLGGAGVSPFDRVFDRYDPSWWDIIAERNFVTVVQAWSTSDLARTAAWLLLLWLATRQADAGSAARRIGSSVLLAAGSAVLAWLAGSWAHNVLLIQLQPWRAMWLVQLLVPAIWVLSALQVHDWTSRRQTLYALACAAMLSTTWSTLVLAGCVALLHGQGERIGRHFDEQRQRHFAFALLAIVAVSRLLNLHNLSIAAGVLTDASMPWLRAVSWEPVVWLSLVGVLALTLHRAQPRRLVTNAVVASGAIAAVAGFGIWYAEAARYITLTPVWISELQRRIPADATVYWQQPLERTWLELRRASYATNSQGASALFSRAQALELQRRLERLRAVGLADGPAVWAGQPGKARLDEQRAIALCQDRALDFVVANGAWPAATTQLPGASTETLSIFECARHRSGTSDASTHEQS